MLLLWLPRPFLCVSDGLTSGGVWFGCRSGGGNGKCALTREMLTSNFTLPLNTVAKKFGLCPTALKKLCRKFGVPRWTHRKVGRSF
jgi:hypothetical protein